jgi:hypothetical protein
MRFAPKALVCSALLLTGACSLAPKEQGYVQTYAEAPELLTSFDGFFWAGPTNAENRLRDQSAYQLIAQELEMRGMQERGQLSPNTMVVAIELNHRRDEVFVPEEHRLDTRYQPGPLYPYTVCDAQGRSYTRWRRSPGHWIHVPVTIPEHTVDRYQLEVKLRFEDNSGSSLWEAELDSQSANGNLLERLEAWIPEMLRAYPDAALGNGARMVSPGADTASRSKSRSR